MSLLDVVVVLAAAVAGWTGWRSGGLHTVVGVACRLAGLIIGVGVADWVATASWGFPARVITEIVVLLLGWVLGGRLAAWLGPAPRPAGRVAGPDRVLGVGVRAALTPLVGALGIQALALWGPRRSGLTPRSPPCPGSWPRWVRWGCRGWGSSPPTPATSSRQI